MGHLILGLVASSAGVTLVPGCGTTATSATGKDAGHVPEAETGPGRDVTVPTGAQCVLLGGNIDVDASTTWLWGGKAWTQVFPSPAPDPRTEAAAATLNGGVVVFGGYAVMANASGSISENVDETWVWGGTSWTEKSATSAPSARSNPAVATLNGKVVLFGGGGLADTWEWDGSTWTEQKPAQSPPGRNGAVAATLNGKVVLFGGDVGMDESAAQANDTWEWDGSTWTEQSPATSPPAREYAVAATVGNTVVLFGGGSGPSGTLQSYLGDTWTWDGTTWTEATPASSPSPRAMASAGALGGVMVVAGGQAYMSIADGAVFGSDGGLHGKTIGQIVTYTDTWTWDGTTWTLSPATGPSGADLSGGAMSCE